MTDVYNSKAYGVWSKFTTWFSEIKWTGLKAKVTGGTGYNLTAEDHQKIKEILASGYFIILTHRDTHLTTYTIGLMTFLKTGKWPYYSHALMNLDLEDNPEDADKFKLMEATSDGVHFSRFMEVFDCDGVCILRPKNMNTQDWDETMKGLAEQLGKPYDNLFNVDDSSHVSCVEMCLDALRESDDYAKDFPNLEAAIKKVGNLTPQMYRECEDFEVVLEIKR